MKKVILSLFLAFLLNEVNSQQLLRVEDNGTTINADNRHVASDFGRREYCDIQWHKGLDINPETYNHNVANHLLAIEGLHLDS